MTKKIFAVILMMVFALSVCLCACNKDAGSGEDIFFSEKEDENLTPSHGGKLSLCVFNQDTLNPLVTKNKANSEILSIMFDSLYKLSDDLYPENCLCESAVIYDEGSLIDMKIREHVKFHSGEELTANDVKFSILLAKNSGGVYSESLSKVTDVIASGNTVKIRLEEPVFNFISNLTFPIIKASSSVENAIGDAGNYMPNGTGVYELSSYDFNKKIKLSAKETHFDGKIPYIKEVDIFIVKDEEAASNMLKNGLVDVLLPSALSSGVNIKAGNIKEYASPFGSFVFLGINNQNPVLLDIDVRRAIAKAVKRDDFSDVLGENYRKTTIPVHPDTWLYYEMQSGNDYSQEEATNMIKYLGFSDTNGDGILEKEIIGEKTELFFEILVNEENKERRQIAEKVKNNLSQASIMSNVTVLPFSEYQTRIANKEYDLFIGEIRFGDNQDISEFIAGADNLFGAYTQSLHLAMSDIKTAESRELIKAGYQKICAELINNMHVAGLYFKDDVVLVNDRIKGKINPNISNPFANICDWFIH